MNSLDQVIGIILTILSLVFMGFFFYWASKKAKDEGLDLGAYFIRNVLKKEVSYLLIILIALILIEGTIVALVGDEHQVNVPARFAIHTIIQMFGVVCAITSPRKLSEFLKRFVLYFVDLFKYFFAEKGPDKFDPVEDAIHVFKLFTYMLATVGVSLFLPIYNLVQAANYVGQAGVLFQGLKDVWNGQWYTNVELPAGCDFYHPLLYAPCGDLPVLEPIIGMLLGGVVIHVILAFLEGLGADAIFPSIALYQQGAPSHQPSAATEVVGAAIPASGTGSGTMNDIQTNTEYYVRFILNRIKKSSTNQKTVDDTVSKVLQQYTRISPENKTSVQLGLQTLYNKIKLQEGGGMTASQQQAWEKNLRADVNDFFRKGPSSTNGGFGQELSNAFRD